MKKKMNGTVNIYDLMLFLSRKQVLLYEISFLLPASKEFFDFGGYL